LDTKNNSSNPKQEALPEIPDNAPSTEEPEKTNTEMPMLEEKDKPFNFFGK
jgi:hypothetical protein